MESLERSRGWARSRWKGTTTILINLVINVLIAVLIIPVVHFAAQILLAMFTKTKALVKSVALQIHARILGFTISFNVLQTLAMNHISFTLSNTLVALS